MGGEEPRPPLVRYNRPGIGAPRGEGDGMERESPYPAERGGHPPLRDAALRVAKLAGIVVGGMLCTLVVVLLIVSALL